MWRIKHEYDIIAVNMHWETPSRRLKHNYGTTFKVIFIDLRDPVDRFVSAFYWRQLVHCDPEGDEREPGTGRAANRHPDTHCTNEPDIEYSDREMRVLYYDYNRDANELASALCSDDAAKSRRAELDMEEIGHTKLSITDWIGRNNDFELYDGLAYPIVMEEPYDILAQVDEGLQWAYNKTRFEGSSAFQRRKAKVAAKSCLERKRKLGQNNNDTDDETGDNLHSSSQSSNKKPLSKTNEACVANYFRSDYKILLQVQNRFCQSTTCVKAIQSILDRRAPYLHGALKGDDGKWKF